MQALVLILDLAGTFVFALAGATAGARRQLDVFGVLVVDFAAAGSSGIAHDLLLVQVPTVSRSDLYALAALAGAAVVVLGDRFGAPAPVAALTGAPICFGLRVMAIRRGWHLPNAPHQPPRHAESADTPDRRPD
jgi:uncharacterized membrane protein YeiH